MGYNLTNSAQEEHQWKVLGWWHLLCIARRYGWEPLGTAAPKDFVAEGDNGEWDGNYFWNSGEEVSAQDAAALALALERFIQDPKREEMAALVAAEMQRAVDSPPAGAVSAKDMVAYPAEFVRAMLERFRSKSVGQWGFSEKADAYLMQFIGFCRRGGFRIE